MSDSELSSAAPRPDDDQIAACLRRVTRKGLSSDDFTVNKARIAAEAELGLDSGFLKGDATWKTRSKEIIEATVNDLSAEEPKATSAKPRAKTTTKSATKRKSGEAPAQTKRPRKKARNDESEDNLDEEESEAQATSSDDDDLADRTPVERKASKKRAKHVSDDESKVETRKAPAKRKPAKKTAPKVVEDSEASDEEAAHAPSKEKDAKKEEADERDASVQRKPETNGEAPPSLDDESDMSVLIDEPPKKKRQKKTSTEPKAKAKSTAKTAKAKKASNEAPSPDEEEIKRLQSWLVKCGIRKMWFKELAPYDTTKAKIKHLKGMLEEAGMTGRYSNEKARDIKERRELAAELEATQEYAKKWGQDMDRGRSDGSDEDEQASEEELKPAKRKPKGLVDFGDSGDSGDD